MSYQTIPSTLPDPVLAPLIPSAGVRDDENAIEIEFDREAGYNFLCIVPSVILPCFAPLFSLCARKNMEAQKCKVTDRRVVFETGWLDHSNKNIPLDRIQDVNVRQNCIQKCFNVHSIEIQTAGMGGGIAPEALLIAPANAMMVRDVIMDRRDALMFGNPGATLGDDKDSKRHVARGGDSFNAAVVEELRSIKTSLARLETQVTTGVAHLKKH